MLALLHIGVSLSADTIQNEVADAPDKEIEKINPEYLIDADEEADLRNIEDDEDEDQDSEETEVEEFIGDEDGLAESEEDENSEMQLRKIIRCIRYCIPGRKICKKFWRRKIRFHTHSKCGCLYRS